VDWAGDGFGKYLYISMDFYIYHRGYFEANAWSDQAGLLLYGIELEYGTRWVGALAGIAMFTFGQEILVTVLLTYMTDCYPDRAAEVAIVFQFFFAIMCYHPPFYLPQWIDQPGGAKVPYIVFAILPIVLFPVCIGILMWRGPAIRKRGPIFSI
jgi:hypothetical protein